MSEFELGVMAGWATHSNPSTSKTKARHCAGFLLPGDHRGGLQPARVAK